MEWKTAWSYLPVNYNTTIGTVENITQRTFFWNNISGKKVKVKFSNRHGKKPLKLEKVVIGKKGKSKNKITNCSYLTYQGNSRIEIAPGEEFYSDELEWTAEPEICIVITIYIKDKNDIQSACSTWSAKSWHTVYGLDGDYTEKQVFHETQSCEVYPYVNADVNKANIIAGISEIKLLSEEQVKTAVLFGDSITHMSYFADALMEMCYEAYPGKVSIINKGIGGNRVLNDATFAAEIPGGGKCFGAAGIKRFEKDVYGTEVPEYVLILEGVNDMMHPFVFGHPEEIVTVKELAAGLTYMIETAHKMGSFVYLGTVMPFKNDEMPPCPEAERIRLELNNWIRKQTVSDGVIEFAKAVEKEGSPEYMRDRLHIGDGLHPNAEGGRIMAKSVFFK